MKITSKRAATIIKRHNDLVELAQTFTNARHSIRIDEYGNIEEWVNTACHCHPEYEWKEIKTAQEFSEWLDKQP